MSIPKPKETDLAEWVNFKCRHRNIFQLVKSAKFFFNLVIIKTCQRFLKRRYTHPASINKIIDQLSKFNDHSAKKNILTSIKPTATYLNLASENFFWKSEDDWKHKFEDPENTFRLHRWNWLLDKPIRCSEEIEQFESLVLSWCRCCEPDSAGSLNDSYSIGERIANVVLFTLINRKSTSLSTRINLNISQMCNMLASQLEYHGVEYTHNHAFNNGRALFLGGISLNDDNYIKLGIEIIDERISALISEDGFLVEGSSHYHFLFTRWILECLWVATIAGKCEFAIKLESVCISLIRRCWFFLVESSNKNTTIPLIGDVSPDFSPDWLVDLPKCQLLGENTPDYQNLEGWAALWNSTKPILNLQDNLSLPKQGWHSYPKSNWHRLDEGNWTCFWHLESGGGRSLTHAHPDALGFVLYWKGIEIFSDPGRMGYLPNNPMHAYGLSPVACNSLLVDHLSPVAGARMHHGRIPQHYRRCSVDIIHKQTISGTKVTITHDGFNRLWKKKLRHFREFCFGNEIFTVTDYFDTREELDVTRFLHLHPDFVMESFQGNIASLSNSEDTKLTICMMTDHTTDIEVQRGVKGLNPAGWYFPSYGQMLPSTTFVIRNTLLSASELSFRLKIQ